jgi:hypothetical protein
MMTDADDRHRLAEIQIACGQAMEEFIRRQEGEAEGDPGEAYAAYLRLTEQRAELTEMLETGRAL